MKSEEEIKDMIKENERMARCVAYDAMLANRSSRCGAFAVYVSSFNGYMSVIEALSAVIQ